MLAWQTIVFIAVLVLLGHSLTAAGDDACPNAGASSVMELSVSELRAQIRDLDPERIAIAVRDVSSDSEEIRSEAIRYLEGLLLTPNQALQELADQTDQVISHEELAGILQQTAGGRLSRLEQALNRIEDGREASVISDLLDLIGWLDEYPCDSVDLVYLQLRTASVVMSIADESIVKTCRERLQGNESDPAITRLVCAEIVSKFSEPDAINFQNTGTDAVRLGAARGLADGRSLPVLVSLLQSENHAIRDVAIRTLRDMSNANIGFNCQSEEEANSGRRRWQELVSGASINVERAAESLRPYAPRIGRLLAHQADIPDILTDRGAGTRLLLTEFDEQGQLSWEGQSDELLRIPQPYGRCRIHRGQRYLAYDHVIQRWENEGWTQVWETDDAIDEIIAGFDVNDEGVVIGCGRHVYRANREEQPTVFQEYAGSRSVGDVAFGDNSILAAVSTWSYRPGRDSRINVYETDLQGNELWVSPDIPTLSEYARLHGQWNGAVLVSRFGDYVGEFRTTCDLPIDIEALDRHVDVSVRLPNGHLVCGSTWRLWQVDRNGRVVWRTELPLGVLMSLDCDILW